MNSLSVKLFDFYHFQDCTGDEVRADGDLIEFDIRNTGQIVIDNFHSTCKRDLDICCIKTSPAKAPNLPVTPIPIKATKTTATSTVVVQKPPKCGQHNPEGLEIKAKHPSDDGNEAFER